MRLQYILSPICALIALSSLSAHAQPAWKLFGNLNQARRNFQAVYIGNAQVLVCGGYAGGANGSPTTSCELIDVNQHTITPTAAMQVARAIFVALLTPDSNVVAIAGDMVNNENSGALTPTIELFDRVTRSWKIIGSLKVARYQHAASFINDHEILVAGGRHEDLSTMADAEIFDMTTGVSRTIANYPFPINAATSGQSSAGDVLVFGGRAGGANSYRERNVYRYDAASNTWPVTGMMADAADGLQTLETWNRHIAISGGSRQDSPLDISRSVQIENNNAWSTLAQMQRERHWAMMAQWTTDTIMTLGGFDNSNATLNSTDWINITTGTSVPGPPMIYGHQRSVAVSVPMTYNNGKVVAASILAIAGFSDGVNITPAVEILENARCSGVVDAGGDQAICSGESVQLDASWGTTFQWSPSTGLSCADCQRPVASPNVTTTYTLQVSDGAGCDAAATVTVTVNPRPTIAQPSTVTICPSTSSIIGVEASDGTPPYTYLWTPATGLSSATVATPTASLTTTTTYIVHVTDANGCRDSAAVTVVPESQMEILSAMSPSGILEIASTTLPGVRCSDIILHNKSAEPIIVSSLPLAHNIEFSIPPSQLPITIPPGEQRSVQICYAPTAITLQRDTLTIDLDCPLVVPIQSYGHLSFLSGSSCNSTIIMRPIDSASGLLRVSDVYPNPASDIALIPVEALSSDEQLSKASCILYNALGNVASEGSYRGVAHDVGAGMIYENGRFAIDVRAIRSGQYFAVIITPTYRAVCPVVVEW